MKIFLFLFLFLNSCSSQNLNNSQIIANLSTGYQYKEQESKLYTTYYYWYKFPSITVCGFYISNKQTKEIKFHISDYKTCEYEIEDGFSVETAKLIDTFRKSFHHQILLAKKDYFKSIVNFSLQEEKSPILIDTILGKLDIVFLEVINVKPKDKLNVRQTPHHKSQRQLTLTNKSLKLFTLKKDINKKANGSWIKVYYFDDESYKYKTGWVHSLYIKSLK